ncbi:hypothetical protein Tco_1423056, partial [Tanacetum coccineum]
IDVDMIPDEDEEMNGVDIILAEEVIGVEIVSANIMIFKLNKSETDMLEEGNPDYGRDN